MNDADEIMRNHEAATAGKGGMIMWKHLDGTVLEQAFGMFTEFYAGGLPRLRSYEPLCFCFLALFFAAVAPACCWPGHSWEEWRQQTGETKAGIITPQAGRSDLVPLLEADAPGAPRIDSIKSWEAKRDRILGTMQELMGHPEGEMKPSNPEAEILGTEKVNQPGETDYERIHLRIRSEADDWIPAYLLIPSTHGPPPDTYGAAMIVIHQTVIQGKEEPCGIETRAKIFDGLDLAVQLVRRGYVCIVPDMIGFGERLPREATQPYDDSRTFYRKHPHWSYFGKMVWDVRRVIDYLETRPEIEPRRIGIIGHSHGAYTSIMTAAMEPRISAVVASCGFTMLRSDPAPERWSELTPLLPRLGFHVDDITSAPIDWHEIISTLAPRPFFNWIGAEDMNFQNTGNLHEVFEQLRDVYSLYGSGDWVELVREPGPHGFPESVRGRAFDWLRRKLPPSERQVRQALSNLGAGDEARKTWRSGLLRLLHHDLGGLQKGPDTSPPPPRRSTAQSMDGFTSASITFVLANGEPTTGTLLVPSGAGVRPAVLVFHQTVPEGQREPLGLSGRPSMHLARELVGRGYVVMTFDSVCAGSRVTSSGAFDTRDLYASEGGISALGVMIRDGMRALDVLAAQPEVEANRLAVAGHSLGAEEALFVAAFDDRVKACVASCGFAPFKAEAEPQRWARDAWFSYMPRLRVQFRAGRLPSWDFDDVIKLVAPRGYFNFQAADDDIFPQGEAIDPLIRAASSVWRTFNGASADRIQSLVLPGKHDFPDEARRQAWDWLDKMMQNERTKQ